MAVFENLKLLKKNMKDTGWVIDSFLFPYREQTYIVLVKLIEENENPPEYASIKLEFLKRGNFLDILSVYANSRKLYIDAKTLREYFGIAYAINLGDILSQFNQLLANCIPTEVNGDKTEVQKEAMCYSLSKCDSKDPRKKYCFSVKRNPVKEDGSLGQRSKFNDNKTRLYRLSLYERLGEDNNLSFRYSTELIDEKSDEEIITAWTKNQTS